MGTGLPAPGQLPHAHSWGSPPHGTRLGPGGASRENRVGSFLFTLQPGTAGRPTCVQPAQLQKQEGEQAPPEAGAAEGGRRPHPPQSVGASA